MMTWAAAGCLMLSPRSFRQVRPQVLPPVSEVLLCAAEVPVFFPVFCGFTEILFGILLQVEFALELNGAGRAIGG